MYLYCLGPFSSSWACVGLHWPSFAAVGLHGPALAFVDLRWPLLAVVGRRWLLGNKNKMKILYIKKIMHLVWALFFPCCPSKPPSTI